MFLSWWWSNHSCISKLWSNHTISSLNISYPWSPFFYVQSPCAPVGSFDGALVIGLSLCWRGHSLSFFFFNGASWRSMLPPNAPPDRSHWRWGIWVPWGWLFHSLTGKISAPPSSLERGTPTSTTCVRWPLGHCLPILSHSHAYQKSVLPSSHHIYMAFWWSCIINSKSFSFLTLSISSLSTLHFSLCLLLSTFSRTWLFVA